MSKNASLTIRMDSDVKNQAQQIFNSLGIDMSTAINVFLKQTIRYQGFPFDLTLNTPNDITAKAINDTINNVDLHGPFDSVEALLEDLNA